MATKRKSGIDRKSLYVPAPSKWDWDKLERAEIEHRLDMARETVERLLGWDALLRGRYKAEMRDMFEQMAQGAKLTEYGNKTWKPPGTTKVEETQKEIAEVGKLLAQVQVAIDSILEHLNPAPKEDLFA